MAEIAPRGKTLSYSLRRSSRARHARLEVSARDGLVVIVPRRFSNAKIGELIEERRAWIERAIRRVGAPDATEAPRLPDSVALATLGERWSVSYASKSGAKGAACRERPNSTLEVSGEETAAARAALQRWLTRRAREGLGERLQELARARRLTVGALSIRSQRTRWASCSANGAVSLNRNLLFLPPELTEVVLLHELCHLREMNHGPRFWRLLEAEVPDLRRRNAELQIAWRHVPRWAL